MTSKEDFKQAIKAGNINEAFLVAMSNAPELNITTRIITAEGDRVNVGEHERDNYLRTQISLIEGKIENEIGEKLTGDRYTEIKQFHLQQVSNGHQTIQHNLISLQKMFQLMSSFNNQSDRSKWVDIAANVTREPLGSRIDTEQLYGNKIPSALKAGENNPPRTPTVEDTELEPQLPSFEADEDAVVDDLMSLADLDDADVDDESREDWSEWLDEPEVKPEVFDLKSLNIRDAKKNWHNWESENESVQDGSDVTSSE